MELQEIQEKLTKIEEDILFLLNNDLNQKGIALHLQSKDIGIYPSNFNYLVKFLEGCQYNEIPNREVLKKEFKKYGLTLSFHKKLPIIASELESMVKSIKNFGSPSDIRQEKIVENVHLKKSDAKVWKNYFKQKGTEIIEQEGILGFYFLYRLDAQNQNRHYSKYPLLIHKNPLNDSIEICLRMSRYFNGFIKCFSENSIDLYLFPKSSETEFLIIKLFLFRVNNTPKIEGYGYSQMIPPGFNSRHNRKELLNGSLPILKSVYIEKVDSAFDYETFMAIDIKSINKADAEKPNKEISKWLENNELVITTPAIKKKDNAWIYKILREGFYYLLVLIILCQVAWLLYQLFLFAKPHLSSLLSI